MERAFSDQELWIVILGLALGSYGLRFTFLGLIGGRAMPDWLLRHLRYTAVAILPALVTPLVLWPDATEGQTDPLRLIAALATFAIGYWRKNVLLGVAAGASVMLAGALLV